MEPVVGFAEDAMVTAEARITALRIGLAAAMKMMREDDNKSQKEVAGRLGTNQAAVAKLESAFRSHSFDSVIRYFAALDAELLVAAKKGGKIYQISDPFVATVEAAQGTALPWEKIAVYNIPSDLANPSDIVFHAWSGTGVKNLVPEKPPLSSRPFAEAV